MKIAMLTTSFPLHAGHSSGTFVFDLAAGLADRGHEVRVLAPHAPGAARRERLRGIDIVRFPYTFLERRQVLAYGGGIPAALRTDPKAPWLVPQFMASFTARAVAHCVGCDVIHAHWTVGGFAGAIAGALCRRPLVITTHGTDINELPDGGLKVGLTRWVLRRAARIVCVSNCLAGRVAEIGLPAPRIAVVHNGVDTDIFTPDNGRPRGNHLIYVGRLSPEKGLRHLLEAVRILHQQVSDIELTLVGDGPERAALEGQARALGLAGTVHFMGARSHDDVPELMRQADIFVLPSLEEGFGIVLIEAMASGLPVVASDTGGIPEIVGDGENGLLVPPGDAKRLAERLLFLCHDLELRRNLADRALCNVRDHFAADAQLRQYESIYGECVRSRRGASVAAPVAVAADTQRGTGERSANRGRGEPARG